MEMGDDPASTTTGAAYESDRFALGLDGDGAVDTEDDADEAAAAAAAAALASAFFVFSPAAPAETAPAAALAAPAPASEAEAAVASPPKKSERLPTSRVVQSPHKIKSGFNRPFQRCLSPPFLNRI